MQSKSTPGERTTLQISNLTMRKKQDRNAECLPERPRSSRHAPSHSTPKFRYTRDQITKSWENMQRIHGPSVLRLSDAKRSILMILAERPGLSVQDVADVLGVSHTTANRHLRALCKKGFVSREKEGAKERHYAAGASEPRALSWLRVAMQDPQRYAVLKYLVTNHGEKRTINKIASDTNMYHGYLSRTLRTLEQHGLVKIVSPTNWNYVVVKAELIEYWESIHEQGNVEKKDKAP